MLFWASSLSISDLFPGNHILVIGPGRKASVRSGLSPYLACVPTPHPCSWCSVAPSQETAQVPARPILLLKETLSCRSASASTSTASLLCPCNTCHWSENSAHYSHSIKPWSIGHLYYPAFPRGNIGLFCVLFFQEARTQKCTALQFPRSGAGCSGHELWTCQRFPAKLKWTWQSL